MRHLSHFDLLANLRNGRSVEQLLSGRWEGDVEVIRFLGIDRDRDGRWTVRLYEVADVGTPDYLDLYSFPDVSEDPEDLPSATFSSIEPALEYACSALGADLQRFVNQGVAESEYIDAYHPQW
ncbi:hypothetical protein FJU31_00820 [Stenotrophomonas cyclobalanopsidis]|uniref:Uncharacterized protein n=1 Tax=Stenotrophomonas cyclobalanopsidis TaxID=2771362 RepID=A0ABQ6T5V4_9GAMM|nr:hypothetical protein [Stenotrophomonas cyclobalanopsidis]KAA9004424.1 hypothetical protein FJU31_00820 [Stenotrophomonas cyclobalanopsidis]